MKRGIAWSVLATLAATLGALFVTPVLIQELGPTRFGLYIFLLTFTSYAGFLDLGLVWASTRYFAEDLVFGPGSDRLRVRFRTLELFLLGVATVSLLGAVFVIPPLVRTLGRGDVRDLTITAALAAVSFGVSLQTGLRTSVLRAAQQFDGPGRVALAVAVLLPIASLIVVYSGGGLVSLVAANVGVNAFGLVHSARLARPLVERTAPASWQLGYLREMASFGGWSTLSRATLMLVLQMDRLAVVTIGAFSGLTYYAVPANLASRVNLVGGASTATFFSRASVLSATGRIDELCRQHGQVQRMTAWCTLALALPLVAFGRNFLHAWIGPEMASRGEAALVFLTIGYAVSAVASVDAATIEGSGRPDVLAKSMAAWAGVTIVALLIGAPRFGSLAVAMAVALWLVGTGFTAMALARRLVLRAASGGGSWWLAGAAAIMALMGIVVTLVRPFVVGLPVTVASMATSGVVVLLLGLFAILTRADRQVLTTAIACRLEGRRITFRTHHDTAP